MNNNGEKKNHAKLVLNSIEPCCILLLENLEDASEGY